MAVSLLLFTVFLLCSAEHFANADHSNDICNLQQKAGPCLGYFEVWYYDVGAEKCQTFVYGGCKGNGNRFNTEVECEQRCGTESALSSSSDEFPKKFVAHKEGPPPCQLEKMLKEKKGPLIGAFIPQCDKDGYYQLKQCWGSTGSCWCVDKFGKEVPHKANAGQHLTCGDVPVSRKPAPCFQALVQSLEPALLIHGLPMSMFNAQKPSCDENGYFKPKQCHKMTCWCTDKWGNKIKNTKGNYDEVYCDY